MRGCTRIVLHLKSGITKSGEMEQETATVRTAASAGPWEIWGTKTTDNCVSWQCWVSSVIGWIIVHHSSEPFCIRILHSRPLPCDFAVLSISLSGVRLLPLISEWPCDLLWSMECGQEWLSAQLPMLLQFAMKRTRPSRAGPKMGTGRFEPIRSFNLSPADL